MIKFKLFDKEDGGYFFFAPIIYSFGMKRISFGLELFGCRFFYFSWEKK